jgi:hypothetical protein
MAVAVDVAVGQASSVVSVDGCGSGDDVLQAVASTATPAAATASAARVLMSMAASL